jgi:hypothetical protein
LKIGSVECLLHVCHKGKLKVSRVQLGSPFESCSYWL